MFWFSAYCYVRAAIRTWKFLKKRKAESSDENKEAYEKGYHLPIKKEEREKAEKDN